MPRVIKEIAPVERTVVCPHCGRTIAFVNNDIIKTHGEGYGGFWSQDYIHCPNEGCHKQIILKSY